MLDKLKDLRDAAQRYEIAREALFQAVERTQNFREGFYSLRMIVDQQQAIGKWVDLDEGDMADKIDALILQFNNLVATTVTQIERIEQ